MSLYRRDNLDGYLEKALWIVYRLIRGRYLTYVILMDKFGMSNSAARRWIAAASRVLPIIDAVGYNERTGYEIKAFRIKKTLDKQFKV